MNPNNYCTLEAAKRLVDAGIVLETDGNAIVPQVAAEIISAIVVTEKALEGREG